MIQNKPSIVTELSSWGVVSIQGRDATKFLQGQITQDVNAISISKAQLGAHLTVKGRVIATFLIMQADDDTYHLLLPKDNIQNLIDKLSKYAIFSKIQITCVNAYKLLAVWTPHTYEDWNANVSENNCSSIEIPHTTMKLLIGNDSCIDEQLQSLKQTHQLVDETIAKLTLLQARIPIINKTNAEIFTVHDLNLPALGAINFKKGCYTGQEIVARTHFRAKLKHHLYLLKFQKPLKENQIFVDERNNEIGRVVNCAKDSEDYYALTWLKDNMLDNDYLQTNQHEKYDFVRIEK